jgi:phage terminase large subunit-like protein
VPRLLDRGEAEAVGAVAIAALRAQRREEERDGWRYDWAARARPEQLPPAGAWATWLILAGRGWGKTRTGAEFVRAEVEAGRMRRVAIVGRTAADVRDVMVEGESGLLAVTPPWRQPRYEPSKRRLTWPNGAVATTFSADKPDLLRGPELDGFWADELAAWRFGQEAWDNLQLALRRGRHPRGVVTTTPRATRLLRDLLADPATHVTRGSTFENVANLAPGFVARMRARYEGTRLGRQELLGEVLDDTPGALWTRARLDALRVRRPPDLVRVVVAVDPAATSTEDADETGIVVAGLGADGHGYVLDDRTVRGTPLQWATAAVEAFREHRADRVVGEANNGGEMVGYTIATVDPTVPFKAVWASRGKRTRAEPIAALDERGLVHHVGYLAELEDQMCTWRPGEDSPDRLDARVWALTELFLEPAEAGGIAYYDERVHISPI